MNNSFQNPANGIELKSIDQLLSYDFWVPQYQRGYRWTSQQVQDLLNDLWAFQKTAPPNTFYCLQPVIVKKIGNKWALIDGQQRLTTIYILLNFLNNSIWVQFKITYAKFIMYPDCVEKPILRSDFG